MQVIEDATQCSYVLVYHDRVVACPPEATDFFLAHAYQVEHMQGAAGEVITCALQSYRAICDSIEALIDSHPTCAPGDLWVGICCGSKWVEFAGIFPANGENPFEDAVEAFESRGLNPMWIYSADVALDIFCRNPVPA